MNPIHQLITKIEQSDLWEKQVTLDRNEFLKVKGSIDTNLYFVVSGTLRIFIVDEVEEHTIRFGYPDNIITSLDSFITDQPSELFIQAIKRTEVKLISKKTFMNLIQRSTENLQLWQTILLALIHQQMERERDLLTSSPVDRYKRVLKRSPKVFQEIPNKYIASYLRMTPETLSRIKKS